MMLMGSRFLHQEIGNMVPCSLLHVCGHQYQCMTPACHQPEKTILKTLLEKINLTSSKQTYQSVCSILWNIAFSKHTHPLPL